MAIPFYGSKSEALFIAPEMRFVKRPYLSATAINQPLSGYKKTAALLRQPFPFFILLNVIPQQLRYVIVGLGLVKTVFRNNPDFIGKKPVALPESLTDNLRRGYEVIGVAPVIYGLKCTCRNRNH